MRDENKIMKNEDEIRVEITRSAAKAEELLSKLKKHTYRQRIDHSYKLKKLMDKSDVLTEEERRKFFDFFKAESPLDQIDRHIAALDSLFQYVQKVQDVEPREIQETVKKLQDARAKLIREKPEWKSLESWKTPIDEQERLPSKKDQGQAKDLYKAIIPQRLLLSENPEEAGDKAAGLMELFGDEKNKGMLLEELEEVCQYFYQHIPQDNFLKAEAWDELKSFNDVFLQRVKQTFLGTKNNEERTKIIKFWLDIEKDCWKKHNYFGAETIRAALSDQQINTIVKTELWLNIPHETQEDFKNLMQPSEKRIEKAKNEIEALVQSENFDFIPAISMIKTLIEKSKEYKFLAGSGERKTELKTPPQEPKRSILDHLIKASYEKKREKIIKPKLYTRIQYTPSLEFSDNSVGRILMNQLSSEEADERKKAFSSIIEIAKSTSLEKQKEFVEAYCKAFMPDLDLSEFRENFSQYLKDEKRADSLQRDYIQKREKIYSEINELKEKLKKTTKKENKKKIKNRIKELSQDLVYLNKNLKIKKECYDESKKNAVKSDLSAIYKKIQEKALQIPVREKSRLKEILKKLFTSPKGYTGNLFTAPVLDFKSQDPGIVEMRRAFERNTKISDCLFISPKMGGANDPGQFGGNYIRAYRTPDGQIRTQIIFFKQATDHGLPNQRENIAEVMAGHIMNGIVGDHTAGIILATPTAPQADAKLDPDHVYIGSLFFREFQDAHQAAHAAILTRAKGRGKGRFGGQDINSILGNPHFQRGFRKLVQDKKLNVSNLAKVLFSSLLVGNYQIHTENAGVATIAGKKDFVGFDLGGAFRRLFKKKKWFKSKEMPGQFPKTVDPYRIAGRKYDTNYLMAFPAEIRESKEFIAGIDIVSDFNREDLRKKLDDAVQYVIDYYGEETFIKKFAKNLDTEGKELNLEQGNNQEKVEKTKKFLYYRLFSRQLSLKSFSLELKLKSSEFHLQHLIEENPVYFKYKNIYNEQDIVTMLSADRDKLVIILNEIKSLCDTSGARLENLERIHKFIEYASAHYDLNNKEDREILIQALNEAHRAIVAQDVLSALPDSTKKTQILESMRSFVSASELPALLGRTPAEIEREKTHREMKNAEQKTAEGIQNIYARMKEKIKGEKHLYDAQGIARVHFSKNDLPEEIRRQFPNKLEKGLTVLIYRKGFVDHPPMHYMLQERMNSLCAAAKKEFGIELSYSIPKEDIHRIITAANGERSTLSKLFKKEMNSRIGDVLNQLFQKYLEKNTETENTPENFAKFLRKIVKSSANIRSESAILSFNENSGHFSFDDGASITSHDRDLGRGCANLSWICDGTFTEQECQITSSTVKHASLAPIDAISQADNMDCLATTYQNLLEVIKKMAIIRQHGRSPEDIQKPMTIDFNYALLTSSMGLDQGQYKAYLYIKRAIQAMDGAVLHIDLGGRGGPGPTEVRVNASVMNAGINVMQHFERSLRKGGKTQERENRKSYLRLTDAVRGISLNTIASAENPEFNKMISQLSFCAHDSLLEENEIKKPEGYAQALKNLTQLTDQLRHQLNLYRRTPPDDNLALDTIKETMNQLMQKIKKAHREFDKNWNQPLEQAQKRAWEHPGNKKKIQEALAYFSSPSGKKYIQTLDPPSLQKLTAYILKAHMDALYYSGEYLQPKGAAVFNAYSLTLQRLTGMMSSTGCKSASDRTAIIRVMFAVLGHSLGNSALPPDFDTLVQQMQAEWVSNGAMLSCVTDTGAPPKVYTDSPLEGTNNFSAFHGLGHDLSAKYGMEFASHKLSKKIKKLRAERELQPPAQEPPLPSAPPSRRSSDSGISFFSPHDQKQQSAVQKWCSHVEQQYAEPPLIESEKDKEIATSRVKTDLAAAGNFLGNKGLPKEEEKRLKKICEMLEKHLEAITKVQASAKP